MSEPSRKLGARRIEAEKTGAVRVDRAKILYERVVRSNSSSRVSRFLYDNRVLQRGCSSQPQFWNSDRLSGAVTFSLDYSFPQLTMLSIEDSRELRAGYWPSRKLLEVLLGECICECTGRSEMRCDEG
jgi:hypothetical protein